jgi:general secretion pathway protein I
MVHHRGTEDTENPFKGKKDNLKLETQNPKPFFARGGFTLLEVMIALAILALVGVAFLRAQASSIRLVDESNQVSLATLLAREKMAELEGKGFPEVGKNSGTGEETYPNLRWEQVVTATELPAVRQALVRILWKDGTRERTLELVAYFAQK